MQIITCRYDTQIDHGKVCNVKMLFKQIVLCESFTHLPIREQFNNDKYASYNSLYSPINVLQLAQFNWKSLASTMSGKPAMVV